MTVEGMLFRVKLARPPPAERNRPDVIQKRVDYANWFMGHAIINHAAITSGQQETKGEQEEGRERTGKFVIKEEEMLRSYSPFHPPMALFFALPL